MGTKSLPLIIMLIGGAACCVVCILVGVDTKVMLERLLVTLICFLIIGCIVKVIVDKNFADVLNPTKEDTDQNGEEESEEGENLGSDEDISTEEEPQDSAEEEAQTSENEEET